MCKSIVKQSRKSKIPSFLFFPGWGFDQRIGEQLPCLRERNWQAVQGFGSPDMVADAHDLLAVQKEAAVHLVGWSMGANLACDFAALFPGQVLSLTLLAMRTSWPAPEIAAIRTAIDQDMPAHMGTFYRKCFLGNKGPWCYFVDKLQPVYMDTLSLPILHAGLSYLTDFTMPDLPADLPIYIVHGRKDVIAPWEQQPKLDQARYTNLDNQGHFLSDFILP